MGVQHQQLDSIVQHTLVQTPTIGQDLSNTSSTRTGSVAGSVPEEEQTIDPPPNNKGMAKQWALLNSTGMHNFGLDFVCLKKFLQESREPLHRPMQDPVFDAAFQRTMTQVIGTGIFVNEKQYMKTKLKPIYDSIESIYDDGANILEDRILEFFPELTIPAGIKQHTQESRNALRASAEKLVARPGGYLHLVCPIHPFNNSMKLTIIRSYRLERSSSINTLGSLPLWPHFCLTLNLPLARKAQIPLLTSRMAS